jgi:hypothetical protein
MALQKRRYSGEQASKYITASLLDQSFPRDSFSRDCFLLVSLSLAPPDFPLSGSLMLVPELQVHHKQAVREAPHEGIAVKHRMQDVQASTPLALRR